MFQYFDGGIVTRGTVYVNGFVYIHCTVLYKFYTFLISGYLTNVIIIATVYILICIHVKETVQCVLLE